MTIPEKSNSCVGVDLPGGGRVHAEGLCACGGRFEAALEPLPALPQPLDRLTAALDELEAVSGELGLEDVLSAYARRRVAAGSEPTYSLSRGGESVRCLECGCAHGKHDEGCTVGAAQHLLALIWRKRSSKNTSTKEAEPNERSAQASEGMRVPGQHHD
jgi:hypothetical protein